MSNKDKDISELIEDAKLKYNQYLESEKDFERPLVNISIERELNDITNVYMDVEYKGTQFQFKSIEEKDINDIYQYLNSQSLVREKYGDGNIISFQSTITRINTFIQRFKYLNSPLYLYSGFTVYDYENNYFLGIANLGSGPDIDSSEMAFLNRISSWSHLNQENYIGNKIYSGVGTIEVFTLLEYAKRLKQDKYLINGHILKSVVATSRIDNQGSWKSCAKSQMFLYNIDIFHRYGNYLRYQLKKFI